MIYILLGDFVNIIFDAYTKLIIVCAMYIVHAP